MPIVLPMTYRQVNGVNSIIEQFPNAGDAGAKNGSGICCVSSFFLLAFIFAIILRTMSGPPLMGSFTIIFGITLF